jgi:hypothetical protein
MSSLYCDGIDYSSKQGQKNDNMEFHGRAVQKHNESINDGRQPTFHLTDFENIKSFERYVSRAGLIASNTDSTILDALLEYEQRGYYKIENDVVNLTDNGLAECRKPVHDWI